LLTNFLYETRGIGYMEAFMEWNLVYRSMEELIDTADRIPPHQIAEMKSYTEENGAVALVELRKAEPHLPRRR
jgi:extracellular factor (EF) 3-hydroxypalmitic acid methyl ester biosynthesis protein